ncbi:hypothetical protein B0H17DRAFT_1123828 [Mycena rosella]|uniref:Uncharacterized protein n=1 Tax=Mycena rosella TaxID=1033263 RepID=A0AAD7H337_MYCRO|nr:hypothetical protein B0H17DRAFT_1123828 [Mycena rosella]
MQSTSCQGTCLSGALAFAPGVSLSLDFMAAPKCTVLPPTQAGTNSAMIAATRSTNIQSCCRVAQMPVASSAKPRPFCGCQKIKHCEKRRRRQKRTSTGQTRAKWLQADDQDPPHQPQVLPVFCDYADGLDRRQKEGAV